MSETAKVRLVRCPKCQNLLPEVTDLSLYQCGGCGAVLRAKNKGVDLDTFSEKSEEERVGVKLEKNPDRYEKVMNFSDRRMMDQMSDGSESDMRSTVSSSSRAERRRVLHERNEFNRTGFNRKEDFGVEIEPEMTREEFFMQRPDRRAKEGSFDHLSSYDFKNPARNNVEIVGDDRAELLRQINELKEKLTRSGNLNDKGKERVPIDQFTMQNSHVDATFNRPPYHNQYDEPPPLIRRQEMGDDGYYPPRYAPSHVYGHPSRSQNHRRVPPETQPLYEMPPPRPYMSGPYMDEHVAYMERMEPYPPPNVGRHHPSCSCYQCRVGRQVLNHGDYNRRVVEPHPLRSHSAQTHARWPSDVHSEVDVFVRRQPLRPHLAAGIKRCSPLAGGAPFLTCNNCCELLFLPKKVANKNGGRKRLRCGACSSVIAFVVSGKSLVVSFDVEAKISPSDVDKQRDVNSTRGSGHPSQTRTNFSSEDYDNSGYDFHSMDRENKSTKTSNRHSASANASEAEEEAVARKDTAPDKGPAPPAGSSLQDYFEYSNKFRVAKDSGAGNRSGRSEHETDRAFPSKNVAKQFLRKESTAAEIDISSNEFSNTGSTFESSEPTRGSREGGSFFAGIMGNFKESNRSEESVKRDNATVTVNGHLISDRFLRKAEKLAGPILPGHYWYDFRAGFWGVMGGPCLGIIPPFIQEFNYPMPEHCAGGNTSIFVNGRELNHKDLNLLGSRGLPRERDRSYIIEISGRVLDEETGEELESLGKLAPTMEKAKRGFGMKVPQAVA